jgi:phosphohistidine phosphatase
MSFTTNDEDQRAAKALQERLANAEIDKKGVDGPITTGDTFPVPSVNIEEGKNKYVLISACVPGENQRQNFVVSSRFAQYHKDAAEPFVEILERNHYTNSRINGGGRIALNREKKTIAIYGYSYGFGLADHALSKAVVEKDDRYTDYEITWSNEGY